MKKFWIAVKRVGWREGLNVLATVLTILVCAGVLWTIVLDARHSAGAVTRATRTR